MQASDIRNETIRPSAGRQAKADGKPLMGLFSDLWRETSVLVSDEAELAKAELSQKVSQMGTGAAELAIAGGVMFAGFLVLLFAAVGVLDMIIDSPHAVWLAPLIVGAIVMIVGYVLLRRGRHNVSAEGLAPGRTLQSLRDDAQLAKEHAR